MDDIPLVIGSRQPVPRVARTGAEINRGRKTGTITSERKSTGGTNKARQRTDHQKVAKIDRENEVAPPPKIPPAVGKAIQQARMEKNLSQKDCAQKINEKPSVLQDYESGKAIPDAQILSKLERLLQVKLRGADIGKKLEGPKKS